MEWPLVLYTAAYGELARRVCDAGGFESGNVARKTFPDGEHYRRIESNVANRHVVLLGGTINDADTLELFDLACAVAKYDARSLTLVVPYFGYSTMERAVRSGEVVTAKTRARLLSAIPAAAVGNRIILVDLHTEGLQHYFEGAIRPIHLYAKRVVLEAIGKLGG